MSGGIAYIWDRKGEFSQMCNTDTFNIEPLESATDIDELKQLVRQHFLYTESLVAENILTQWDTERDYFVKVMPIDYKRVLDEMEAKAIKNVAIGQ